jgi:hypothetical protein
MKKLTLMYLSMAALLATSTVAGANPGMAESKKDKAAPAAKEEKISVPKASGANAYTVEGAFTNSAKLSKQKIVVRGKVVKVSSGIMGKNWIHLQDGSGTAAKSNNDLVFTSKDTAKVGDVITASGTLGKDRDFGSGYKYSVIIEDATFKK